MEYTQLYHTNRYVRYVRMYIATVRTTDKPHMGTHEQSFICIDIKKRPRYRGQWSHQTVVFALYTVVYVKWLSVVI